MPITPRGALGFNLITPPVAIDQESLTYAYLCGNHLVVESVADGEAKCDGRAVQFFAPVKVHGSIARKVTAVAFHAQSKILALCVTLQNLPPTIAIYRVRELRGAWIPSILDTLVWDFKGPAEFRVVDLSRDASVVVGITKFPSQTAVGFDRSRQHLLFATRIDASVEDLHFNPWDTLGLSTSGPGHVQLWRLIKTKLKSRTKIKHLLCANLCYTKHRWLARETLIAGTNLGDIVMIHQNEQTQRFQGIHIASIQGILLLQKGFATVCSACRMCIFEHDDKLSNIEVKLTRCIHLDVPQNVQSVGNFPGKGVSETLLVTQHVIAILDLTALIRADQSEKRFKAKQLGQSFRGEDFLTMSGAMTRPILASCSRSTNVICIWNWKSSELVLKHAGDGAFQRQALVCLDMHPSGFELLVGLENEVCSLQVGHQALVCVERVTIKGVVPLGTNEPSLVSTSSLSILKYAHGGHLFAAVTGRLVQVFDSHSQNNSGKPALVHALQGHACDIKGLIWSIEDQRIFTCSDDGAIYEWSIGSLDNRLKVLSRTRDYVRIKIKWSSMSMFSDGALAIAGTPSKSQQTALELDNSFIRIWCGTLDDISVDLSTANYNITTILAINPVDDCQGMLVAGTTIGCVLRVTWPSPHEAGASGLEEIPLCDGPIVALTFSCCDQTLCVASTGGTIMICDAGKDGYIGHSEFVNQAPANVGVRDQAILIEHGLLGSLKIDLEELVGELVQTKLTVKKACDEALQKFEMRLQAQREENSRHAKESQLATTELAAELVKKENAYMTGLLEMRSKFDFEVQDLTSIYEKKMALQATRYIKLREKSDKLRLEAQDDLKQQTLNLSRSEQRWKLLSDDAKKGYESETKLLQEERMRVQHWALELLERQGEQGDMEILRLREEAFRGISNSKHKLSLSLRETADLKQKNDQLTADYHKNRDELTECQQACHIMQDAARKSKAMLSEVMSDLRRESEQRVKFEEILHAHESQLADLQRVNRMLSDHKVNLRSTITDREATCAELENRCRRLDKNLEAAGQQTKVVHASLQSKASELQRARQSLNDYTQQTSSRDKKIHGILERIDALLSQFHQSPIILSDLNGIRDAIACLQSERNQTITISSSSTPFEKKNVHTAKRDRRLLRNSMVFQLRSQNADLMEQLNDLRFDRQSLRRKLNESSTSHS